MSAQTTNRSGALMEVVASVSSICVMEHQTAVMGMTRRLLYALQVGRHKC